MEIVLGVSMAPSTIRMVLVEGQNAGGVTVDEDHFDVDDANDPATLSAPDQVVAAILGTREGAAEAGHQMRSTGVTWTDPADAAALAAALAARNVENVMLVSAFLAAAALAQTVGQAMNYEHIAMLFVEPDSATRAVVDSTDGSVTEVCRCRLPSAHPLPELAALTAGLHALETPAQGLFVVGCGVDIAPIKPALEATLRVPVSAPEEPDTALARGAALASANAPLFGSSTAALAYAQDPGTGKIDPYAVSPGYLEVPIGHTAAQLRGKDLAYSAAPDPDADAQTGVADIAETYGGEDFDTSQQRRPLLLVGSVLAVIVVSAALALEIALALGIRPAVALRPTPGHALVAPAVPAPTPQAPQLIPEPHPIAVRAAPPPLRLPAPAPIAVPAPAPAPIPAAPIPVPVPVPIRPAIPAPPPVQVPINPPRMNLPVPRQLWQPPNPPAQIPAIRQPVPQWRPPMPQWRGSLPQPPINLPGPAGPGLPSMPAGPGLPGMPAGPGLPSMPGPRVPTMPAPRLPSMPAPMVPRMPTLPRFGGFPGFRF